MFGPMRVPSRGRPVFGPMPVPYRGRPVVGLVVRLSGCPIVQLVVQLSVGPDGWKFQPWSVVFPKIFEA